MLLPPPDPGRISEPGQPELPAIEFQLSQEGAGFGIRVPDADRVVLGDREYTRAVRAETVKPGREPQLARILQLADWFAGLGVQESR